MAGQIKRLDRTEGDIDVLSKRLAFIRTWTYAANRTGWVADADHWRGETRAVEDRLSDALHARLTQRFVDRRTSHLMRRLKQKERLVAEVNDKGEVHAEGHFLGRLDGFRFTVDESASGDELKTLRSASLSALQAEFARKADKLYLSPDTEIDVTEQGGLMWGTDAVGRVTKGDKPLEPGVSAFVDDMAPPEVAEKVERRLKHWLGRKINALFEPMIAMRDDETITGLARGVAFALSENFGVVPRAKIAGDIKQLAQEDRAMLRKHGVRFGQHFIFMPVLLKPAPTRMRLLLWSLAQDLPDFPESPPPGLVTVPVNPDLPPNYYEMAGYRPAGSRALRIDMMERLADMLRNQDVRGGFEATQDMLSITGLSLELFSDLLGGLGYEGVRGERPKPARAKPETPAESEPEAKTDDATAAEEVPAETAASDAEPSADKPEEPPAEVATPTNEGSAEAATPVDADATAEDDTPAEADATKDADATAEAASDNSENAAPVAADATEDTPAAPTDQEMEVFYTFKLKPRARPSGPGRGQGQRAGQGQRQGQGGRQDGSGGPGKSFAGKGKGKGRGPKGKGGGKDSGPRRMEARPPKKDRPIDPDNPFAILQKLKDE